MLLPAPLPFLFASTQDVEDLLSVLGVDARLDDQDTGAGRTADAQRQMVKALSYATTRVGFYCVQRYDMQALAGSWLVNEWATTIAAHWVCAHRLNSIPDVLRELMFGGEGKNHQGVMGDLADVRAERASIPDVGVRNVPWFSWTNVRVDPRYRIRQIRVERAISERTPTQFAQTVDWPSEGASEV